MEKKTNGRDRQEVYICNKMSGSDKYYDSIS